MNLVEEVPVIKTTILGAEVLAGGDVHSADTGAVEKFADAS